MLIFHPEVHSSSYKNKVNILKEKANTDEFSLLLECKQYRINNDHLNHINGFESLEIYYKECILCSVYQMSQVPYDTLKEGGIHSTSVFIFFLCSIYFFPEMKLYIEKYKNEVWYNELEHFIEPLSFDIFDYDTIIDNMKQFIRMRAKIRGGLPANIPYIFIRDCITKQIQLLFPDELIDTIVIQKTLIEREYYMAENIKKALNANSGIKDIHVCIGAGHLMPYLSQKCIDELGLDSFFVNYHKTIQLPRLLDYFKECEYEIQLL